MVRLAIEVAVAVAISVAVLWSSLVGPHNYAIIGGLVAAISLVLIYSTHGFADNDENAPTVVWLLVTAGICVLLGAVWPSVPLIMGYQRTLKADTTKSNSGNT